MEGFTAESDEAHDRALEYARKGVCINPASHSNFLALGMVYIANGKTDQAVQAIERGIELNPNDPDGLGFLATALCLQGKPDEAIARVSEAARTNPGLRLERRAETAMFHFVARRYTESVEAVQGLDDPPASAVMFTPRRSHNWARGRGKEDDRGLSATGPGERVVAVRVLSQGLQARRGP